MRTGHKPVQPVAGNEKLKSKVSSVPTSATSFLSYSGKKTFLLLNLHVSKVLAKVALLIT